MGLFDKIKKTFKTDKNKEETPNNNSTKKIKEKNYQKTNYNINNSPKKTIQIPQNNFTYLDQLIHSGQKEIILEQDIIIEEEEENKYLEGILIDLDDIIINGNGYTINAKKKTRIFRTSGKNILIRNITLQNGFADCGGAIYNTETLTIKNSTFKNNIACESGGAIYNLESDVTLINTTLDDNIAFECSAILNGGLLKIQNSKIINNKGKASNHDYFDDDLSTDILFNKGKMNIDNSIIQGNCGNYIIDNIGILNINNTVIKNNSAKHIISNSESSYINNGEITNNILLYEYDGYHDDIPESTIYNTGTFTIKNTILNTNKSCENSNYLELYGVYEYENIDIINGRTMTFSNIKINNDNKNIINCGKIITLKEDYLEKNIDNYSELYSDDWYDGERYVEYLNYNEEFNFTKLNEIIHTTKNKVIILENDYSIEEYERDFFEGGIDLDVDDLVIDGQNHTIDGNNLSRIFIITGKNITLKNIIIKNGHSIKIYTEYLHITSENHKGGAIRNTLNGDLNLKNCILLKNESDDDGGAIHNQGTITIENTTLQNDTATGEYSMGGAISNQGTITIKDSTLQENTSKYGGGAIYNQGTITLTDTTLSNNTAQEKGGAIVNWGTLNINNSEFKDNTPEDIYE